MELLDQITTAEHELERVGVGPEGSWVRMSRAGWPYRRALPSPALPRNDRLALSRVASGHIRLLVVRGRVARDFFACTM